jgi:hypothetical protein
MSHYRIFLMFMFCQYFFLLYIRDQILSKQHFSPFAKLRYGISDHTEDNNTKTWLMPNR